MEKHPEVTLGELLNFMSAFNLRFGQAKTEPPEVAVRDPLPEARRTCATRSPRPWPARPSPKTDGSEVGEFFSGMDYQDLQKKAPPPLARRAARKVYARRGGALPTGDRPVWWACPPYGTGYNSNKSTIDRFILDIPDFST